MRSILAAAALLFGVTGTVPAFSQDAAEQPPKVDLAELTKALEGLPTVAPRPQEGYDPSRPVVGSGISSYAEGMRINVVVAGSAAEQAGLQEGMIILRTNGITMKGFETGEVVKILGKIEGEITFDIEGRGRYSLIKAPIPQTEG